ncbi:MAG: hypothetical protein AUG51_03265 [Acidobacteria bacterium 13_1_20CM_3_53_8]|nr:MAG: hypothetical protein AUG51_03265 [Acidobacteria bacterium 13_1_20CM_3_53_8]
MKELRERGIYALPDGREFVIHAVFRGGYILYTPVGWEFSGVHLYESDDSGRIRSNGRPTHWNIGDLTDTSRTARSRSRNGAAQKPFTG